jgi:hypothetical protein
MSITNAVQYTFNNTVFSGIGGTKPNTTPKAITLASTSKPETDTFTLSCSGTVDKKGSSLTLTFGTGPEDFLSLNYNKTTGIYETNVVGAPEIIEITGIKTSTSTSHGVTTTTIASGLFSATTSKVYEYRGKPDADYITVASTKFT